MSGGLRRLAATVGTGLLHVVTLGTLLALATTLPPQVFGAGCLVFLAGGAVVLAYHQPHHLPHHQRRRRRPSPTP